jgi:hypothetical protein
VVYLPLTLFGAFPGNSVHLSISGQNVLAALTTKMERTFSHIPFAGWSILLVVS